jgi:hypothetical protein
MADEQIKNANSAENTNAPVAGDNLSGKLFTAYSLSQFIPGLGHIYLGDSRRGAAFLVPWLLCSVAAISLYFQWPLRQLEPDSELLLLKMIAGLLSFGWIFWFGSLFALPRSSAKSGDDKSAGAYSFCYSIIFPGWGQAAAGNYRRAISYALTFSVGAASILIVLFTYHNWHKLTGVAARELLELLLVPALALGWLAPISWVTSLLGQRRYCRKYIAGEETGTLLLKPLLSGTRVLQLILVTLLLLLAIVTLVPRKPTIDLLENQRQSMTLRGFLIIPGMIEKLENQIARHPAIYEDQLASDNNSKFTPPQSFPMYPPPLYGKPPTEATAPPPTTEPVMRPPLRPDIPDAPQSDSKRSQRGTRPPELGI